MLTEANHWLRIAEINPPELPNLQHRSLSPTWSHVLVTDNVFGRIRVSPYAFSARITHDTPNVHPTVVVSTRDRNILAIESEVRGALGNGVDSFLVVIGDTVPHVDHLAHHYEIVEHLRELQENLPNFEVGMPTRFREWQFRRRIELGAQFFVTGPILDPEVVEEHVARLNLKPEDPPVFLMIIPPFSPAWVEQMETIGAVPVTDGLKQRLSELAPDVARKLAWDLTTEMERRARDAGAAGVVLMGLKFDSLVSEAAENWPHPG
ncbi:MAG TPA: methylenetetrahydrofolate reductase [Acidimicrobiia bacterium]|jgi:5,10-methylenetetrahydrofolate reductase|nr:methylenetetrahydrofolate reductase [Acidimicrobiia bacterium]